MALLNIFANFRIDTKERYLHMKYSFYSFKDIPAEKWIINIRGPYAKDSIKFLHENLKEKFIPHEKCNENGWLYDTRQMLSDINSEYILLWIEDHANLAKISLLQDIIEEMKKNDIDSLWYSWWKYGHLRKRYHGVQLTPGNNIDYFNYTLDNNKIIQSNGGSFIISAVSIFKTSFFKKIISVDDPIPRRWPKDTPFDFEKGPNDIHWLPFKHALPKQELFACIDKDSDCENYCLQTRGLYPENKN